MPTYYPESGQPLKAEPNRRFYPTQEPQAHPQLSTARPQVSPLPRTQDTPVPSPTVSAPHTPSGYKNSDASYLMHRHPILLQRLYDAADSHLSAYRTGDFIYDAYPDYLSLRLLRDRLLRENLSLTEEFLQAGCPSEWLNLLTDTVLSELLCRKRHTYRNPMGDATTTSVRSVSLS